MAPTTRSSSATPNTVKFFWAPEEHGGAKGCDPKWDASFIWLKGYFREDFDDVFRRYIPRKEAKAMLEEITVSAERPGGKSPGPAVGEGN